MNFGRLSTSSLLAALLLATAPAHAKPIYFTGNAAPTIWVGDTGGAGVAPAAPLYDSGFGGVVGIDESEGQLFWATARSHSVMTAPASGAGAPSALGNALVAGSTVQLDVAVDRAGGRYFFTVTEGASPGLYQASLDGSGAASLIDVGVGPTGVIYDPASDYLYFTNNTEAIRRVRPDGSGLEDLLVSTTDTFCDITADFAAGLIYYTQNIEAVGVLDLATGAVSTLYDPEGTVRSVELDPSTQTLYWAAFDVNPAGDDAVQSAAASGGGPISTLYQGDFHNLRGLTLGGNPTPEPTACALLAAAAAMAAPRRRRL